MLPTMEVLVEYAMYIYQGKIPMSTEGMMCISGTRGVWVYLTVWSTSGSIGVPAVKILCKDINPKGRW